MFYNCYLKDFKKDPKDKRKFNYLITLSYQPNWLGRLFRLPEYTKEYFGNYAVWRDAKTWKRQNTSKESWLCDIWSEERRNRG